MDIIYLSSSCSDRKFDELRERAMPKRTSTLSVAQKNRIKALSASNYTLAEIANKLGVSTSTVSKYLKE